MALVGSTSKALHNSTSVDVDVAFYDVVVSLMCCHSSSMASNKLLSTSATMFAMCLLVLLSLQLEVHAASSTTATMNAITKTNAQTHT